MRGRTPWSMLPLAALGSSLTLATPSPAQPGDPFARVRSSDPAIRALLIDGRERSATLRALVERIEATDGFVYVQPGRCPRGMACLVHHVAGDDRHRYLRIRVTLRLPADELIASIGHELQHALEVLEARSVRTGAAVMLHFITRDGRGARRSAETSAAVRAGAQVLAEVRQTR